MRLILLVAIVLPLTTLCQSKKDRPSFGKVAKEELQQTTFDFDKEAEAVVLLDLGRMYVDINGYQPVQALEHHVRIKILTNDGLNRANIKLAYRSFLNDERISNISASTYNLDAAGNTVVTKLEKNLIYQKKINAKYSEYSFTLPDVKVGSIIEYKYTWTGYNERNWVLQQDIPVKLSSYELDFPAMFELHTRPICSLPYKVKDESTSIRTIKKFSMENIPAFRNEEYMSCKVDYIERVEWWPIAFTYDGRRYPLLKTWPQVAKSLIEDEDFGVQLKKEIPRTADLDAQLATLSDPYNKMLTIHNYVRKNMSWDGINTYWAGTGVKAAWKEKVGTSGEINLILINLLRDAGIKVEPLMVSTRSNGRVSTTFPNQHQFNKVLALVDINDKKYVLDGTDKYTPAGLIPENVMYSEGMVIDPTSEHSFRWYEIWDDSKVNKNVVMLQAFISPAGDIKGHVTVSSFEYARTNRVPEINNREKLLAFIVNGKTDLEIDSINLKNADSDSLPLIQEFDFHGPVNASGEYTYFSTNLFAGLRTNPFISDSRVSDIFFGTNQSYQILANIHIPEGYTFEELPKNTKMTIEDKSLVVTRMVAASGNILNARTTLEFKRPVYSPDEYPDLREFYKKMYTLLDEQIVIKKKTN